MFSVSLVLKLAGATLSAVLGVIALLGDFRDPKSKRLTLWGRATLAGLALGAVLTIGTELVEKKEQADEAGKRLKETQELLRETQLLLQDSQGAQRKLQALLANGQTLEARTDNLLSTSKGTLDSTRALSKSSYEILLAQQKQQNPIKDQIAVAYRTMPRKGSEFVRSFLASKAAEYLELIRSATAAGRPIQGSDGIAEGDSGLPREWINVTVYKPKPGITLQVDQSGKPVFIAFDQHSEVASRGDTKGLFDTADVTFSIWLASIDPGGLFDTPQDAPANLVLTPIPISNEPQSAIPLEGLERERERVDPLIISWNYDFRKGMLWKYSSLRLTDTSSDGALASVLDLPGATMAIKGDGDVCWVDLYAGRYQYTISRSQIKRDDISFEVAHLGGISSASRIYFKLPAKPTFVPVLANDLRPGLFSHPSGQQCR